MEFGTSIEDADYFSRGSYRLVELATVKYVQDFDYVYGVPFFFFQAYEIFSEAPTLCIQIK